MKTIMLCKNIGIAPNAYTCFTAKEFYMLITYEVSLILSFPVGNRKQSIGISMAEHHNTVCILNGMYYLRIRAGFINMQATILSLIIKMRKDFCCRVICMNNYHIDQYSPFSQYLLIVILHPTVQLFFGLVSRYRIHQALCQTHHWAIVRQTASYLI